MPFLFLEEAKAVFWKMLQASSNKLHYRKRERMEFVYSHTSDDDAHAAISLHRNTSIEVVVNEHTAQATTSKPTPKKMSLLVLSGN